MARFEAEGAAGLADRSSRPHRLRRPTPESVRDEIVALRREKMPGQQIARITGVSPATVSRALWRNGRVAGGQIRFAVHGAFFDRPVPRAGVVRSCHDIGFRRWKTRFHAGVKDMASGP